jgi:ABC-type amino acid transport substrate-binding protein
MSRQEPYVGPRSFEPNESRIFFGRTEEVDRLVSLVLSNRTVVLCGQSGAGKTSLINAGLLPALQAEGIRVVRRLRVIGPEPHAVPPSDHVTPFEAVIATQVADALEIPPFAEGDAPSLRQTLALDTEKAEGAVLLLVFDQFEELFSARVRSWADRDRFLDVLIDLLDEFDSLRLLFSIREEWLADIDERAPRFRDGLRARQRLHGLTRGQAAAAVREPLKATGADVCFSDGAVNKLLHDLMTVHVEDSDGRTLRVPGEYIEPVQLQVVCAAIWAGRNPEASMITERDLETVGTVDQVLGDYFDDAVRITTDGRYEDELFLRNWFEHQLITAAGTRGLVHASATDSAGVPLDRIRLLQGLHVVRMEVRAGARWVELSHDRMIDPIRRSNARWRDTRGAEVVRATTSTLKRIRMIGAVRMGVTLSPPFCFEDETGALTGEAIVVAREVFRDLGIHRMEPVISEFARLGGGLESGKFDLANAGIFITDPRARDYSFSLPTLVCSFGLLVRSGNPKSLHSFEDIRDTPGAVVGASNRTEEYDLSLKIGIPPDRVVGFARASMGLEALRAGRIDAFATLTLDLPYFVNQLGSDIVEAADPFSDPVVDGQGYRGRSAMMMRKGDTELVEAVNAVLRRFVGTERHAQLVAPFGITREMLPDI